MPVTDPVADLLTRIRNANTVRKEKVDIPSSKLKKNILEILKQEGYIRSVRAVEEEGHPMLRVYLKYGSKQERIITRLERVSTPSVRRYAGKDNLPRVINGLGIAIISTSQGVMTDRDARRRGIGGEILCRIW
jgi:small subunit ribosomal protein S8